MDIEYLQHIEGAPVDFPFKEGDIIKTVNRKDNISGTFQGIGSHYRKVRLRTVDGKIRTINIENVVKLISKDLSSEEYFNIFADVEMQFVSYYKYLFKFEAETEYGKLCAYSGGNAGELYRMEIEPFMKLMAIGPEYLTLDDGDHELVLHDEL